MTDTPTRSLSFSAALALLSLLLQAPPVFAQDISIADVRTYFTAETLNLSARLGIELTDKVRDAVNSGIPVVMVIKVRVDRPREYWWSEEVLRLRRRYELRYHALAERYLVTDLSGEVQQQRFRRLDQALEYIGRVQNFRLLSRKQYVDIDNMLLRLNCGLDIGSLPTPLRLWAYLDSGWYVQSDWYERPLTGTEQ